MRQDNIMKNQESFLHYISNSKIIKKSNIQINIPTFNGYEITKKTIKKLYEQKSIEFDILLIDNNSDDYKKLIKDFPNLNYIVLKENTGSSGAQRIGAELALKNNYDYIIFTDNDAVLIDNHGLAKMRKYFKRCQVVAVVPQNIELKKPQGKIRKAKKLKGFFPLHYFFIKISVLKITGLHDFNMFLSGDDASISAKLLSAGEIIIAQNVLFYHPVFQPKNIQNRNIFLTIRSLIILIFFENNINLKWRFRAFLFIFFIFSQAIFHSIRFLDTSYFKTLFLTSESFFYGYKNVNKFKELLKSVPENKYILTQSTDAKEFKNSKKLSMLNNFFLIYKSYYFFSNYYNKNIYFILKRNEK